MATDIPKPDHRTDKCLHCHQVNTWRILLRNCNHVICIFCGLEYIRHWIQDQGKARIKCPKKSCKIRIHENDIKAMLDSENPALDCFMSQSNREWLQYKHDKDVIGYALGAPKFARQCPLCQNFYAKMDGCNYVRCPNLRCNQWFCFSCGDPIETWQHFSQGRCRVSWDDVYKLTYLMRFLVLSNALTNFVLLPFIWICIWVFLPLFVLFSFPYYTFQKILKTKYAVAKALIASPLIVASALILFVGTVLTAFPLYICYFVLSVAKCVPPAAHMLSMIDYAGHIAGIFGFGNWKQILMDSRDARMELEIDEKQKDLEKSERLATIERNTQQEQEYEAAELAREARKDRAIGVAQCGGGAVDVGKVIKKGAHNVEAIQKGNIQDIKFIGVGDVKINDKQAVMDNVKGKAGKVIKFAAVV